MHFLVTGANGYIGKRLIRGLLNEDHEVTATVRDKQRFDDETFSDAGNRFRVVEADFLEHNTLKDLPEEVDAAYYLIHSMSSGDGFKQREARCAENFAKRAEQLQWKHLIYLGGLVEESRELSEHLASRIKVEEILEQCPVPLTALRASIIVGSGSGSFEIVRDLSEKLPVMITPRWVHTRCQPIAIRNVINYLIGVALQPASDNRRFDIGGPEVMSYLELIKRYAEIRGLRRFFIPTPVLSPRLSSGWLCLLTTTSFPLARALVDSLTHETVCKDGKIRELIPQDLLSYERAVELALEKIAQNHVPSSWMDSLTSGTLSPKLFRAVKVPEHGVLHDQQVAPLKAPKDEVIDSLWSVGGDQGWPSMNWAWKLRGTIDKWFGGIGIRRGRRHPTELRAGEALDFWRVLLADREHGRLILYAEMKLPGEAWLEFSIEDDQEGPMLRQRATFRPQGLLGRLYWLMVLPLHLLLFPQMARRLAKADIR
ncbi:MAG: DUF2867 domain-containing protein [Akkermansiaceae bacterium]|nr:DUF2867 domain-containing protein [Akkermansiaceae bacterium]